MSDPKKYDKDNNIETGNETDFTQDLIAKRLKLIRQIADAVPLMMKECESLESYINKYPDSNASGPFKEKITGWSKVINGVGILERMYFNGNN